jgi:hypothetical protein
LAALRRIGAIEDSDLIVDELAQRTNVSVRGVQTLQRQGLNGDNGFGHVQTLPECQRNASAAA